MRNILRTIRGQLSRANRAAVRGRVPVFRAAGLTVSLHWSWLLLAALIWWLRPSTNSFLWTAIELTAVFLIVLLHELGHVLMARWHGLRAGEIILWPLGGLATIERTKYWRSDLLIALAGPAVNAALVPALYGLCWHLDRGTSLPSESLPWRVARINFLLLWTNLLPIWPLDGGRIADAALRARFDLVVARLVGSILGLVVAAAAIAAWGRYGTAVDVLTPILLGLAIYFNVKMMQWALAALTICRREGTIDDAYCPQCRSPAVDAATSTCAACGEHCNLLHAAGVCWNCGTPDQPAYCPSCQTSSSVDAWMTTPSAKAE